MWLETKMLGKELHKSMWPFPFQMGVEATALTDQRLLAMQAEFQKLCVAFPRHLAGC